MNYGKAQQVLKSKFPTMYHKYSFRGQIRTYRNKLTHIDEDIVKYIGTTTRFVDIWNMKTPVPVTVKKDNGDGEGFEGPIYNIQTPVVLKVKKQPTQSKQKRVGTSSPLASYMPDPIKIAIRKEASKLPELQHLIKRNIVDGQYKCCYCEVLLTKKNYTKDHIIPIDRGGTNDIKNIRPCCEACNVEKGNMMLHSYIQMLNLLWADCIIGNPKYILLQNKIKNANEIAKTLKP